MTTQPPRSYTKLAVAIVVAAVVVSAAIFAASVGSTTVTKTLPEITTLTNALTSTETTTLTELGSSTTTTTVSTIIATTTLTVLSTVIATSSTSSTTAETTCIITGQPGPFFLRVVSDANQTPIAGAQVTATNQPASAGGGGSASCLATNQTTLTFTTNNTEWYSLGSQNNAGYSLYVRYLGQSYNFTADLRPLSVTCASLYIPSGETNVTITEFQTTCPQTITTTTTS